MQNKDKNIKCCELCYTQATCLCYKCFIYFCDSCFKFIHDKKANSEHKKEKIDYFVPIDTKCPDHPLIPLTLFCTDEKGNFIYLYLFLNYFLELCCAICHFKNLHSGHKLIEINDEELLKKENITIESSIKDFDEIIKKAETLKKSIEKEITEIDKLYY